jgi:hypothetical protein
LYRQVVLVLLQLRQNASETGRRHTGRWHTGRRGCRSCTSSGCTCRTEEPELPAIDADRCTERDLPAAAVQEAISRWSPVAADELADLGVAVHTATEVIAAIS